MWKMQSIQEALHAFKSDDEWPNKLSSLPLLQPGSLISLRLALFD